MAGSGDTLAGNEESSEERAVPRGATKGAGSRRFRTVALALVVVATSVAMIIVALSLRPPLTTIRVAGGLDFFDNAEVQEILDAKGIRVQRTSVGSRSLTTLAELQEYDAIIPGGRIAADQVATTLGATTDQVNTYDAWRSQTVIATPR